MTVLMYRCETCGHVCSEYEMGADYAICGPDGEEVWSNWICPSCKEWHSNLNKTDSGWKKLDHMKSITGEQS